MSIETINGTRTKRGSGIDPALRCHCPLKKTRARFHPSWRHGGDG